MEYEELEVSMDTQEPPKQKKKKTGKIVLIVVAVILVVVLLLGLLAAILLGLGAAGVLAVGAFFWQVPVADVQAETQYADIQVIDPDENSNVAWEDNAQPDVMEVTHYITIEIEDYVTLHGELYGNMAPLTVENFTSLAQSGFYDGLTFHRIIEGFMMQGGAPDSLSPEVAPIKGEFSANGVENTLLHEPGVLSMARTNNPDSATSQFFIVHQTSPHLDGQYAAFGRITEGLDIVDRICADAEPVDNNGTIYPGQQPVIAQITVTPA